MSLNELAIGAAVVLLVLLMLAGVGEPRAKDALVHWHEFLPGIRASTADSYAVLRQRIEARQLPGVEVSETTLFEEDPFSFRRRYLCVKRDNLAFYIFGAPLDNDSFYLSYWLVRPEHHDEDARNEETTLFQSDAEIHFKEAIHAVVAAFGQELALLSDSPAPDRARPLLRELYRD